MSQPTDPFGKTLYNPPEPAAQPGAPSATSTQPGAPYLAQPGAPHYLPPGFLPHGAPGDVVQGGFLRRAAALYIDSVVLQFIVYPLLFVLLSLFVVLSGGFDDFFLKLQALEQTSQLDTYIGLFQLACLPPLMLSSALYHTLMDSSEGQGSLGKRAFGIKVTNAHGGRLTRAQAFQRWLCVGLSYLSFYVGFLMIFGETRRTLHDRLSGTQVVDRWAYTDQPERQLRGRHTGALVLLLVMVVLPLAMLLIVLFGVVLFGVAALL